MLRKRKPIIIINKKGKGKGNWGHKGIPGHRGGSADRDMPGEKDGADLDAAADKDEQDRDFEKIQGELELEGKSPLPAHDPNKWDKLDEEFPSDAAEAIRIANLEKKTRVETNSSLAIFTHGGKGSGNWGHEGGEGGKGNPGGSAPATGQSDWDVEQHAKDHNQYIDHKGHVWSEPDDVIDWDHPELTIKGEELTGLLTLEQLRALPPDHLITVKGYSARRGGVNRRKIKVGTLVLR